MKHGMETCWWWWKWKVKFAQSCLTLCHPKDYIDHGILQARLLEWVAFPFSRGSYQLRDRTKVSCIAGGCFTNWATREAPMTLEDYFTGQQRFILTLTSVFAHLRACILPSLLKSVFTQGSSICVTTSPSVKGIRHITNSFLQRNLVLE